MLLRNAELAHPAVILALALAAYVVWRSTYQPVWWEQFASGGLEAQMSAGRNGFLHGSGNAESMVYPSNYYQLQSVSNNGGTANLQQSVSRQAADGTYSELRPLPGSVNEIGSVPHNEHGHAYANRYRQPPGQSPVYNTLYRQHIVPQGRTQLSATPNYYNRWGQPLNSSIRYLDHVPSPRNYTTTRSGTPIHIAGRYNQAVPVRNPQMYWPNSRWNRVVYDNQMGQRGYQSSPVWGGYQTPPNNWGVRQQTADQGYDAGYPSGHTDKRWGWNRWMSSIFKR